MSHLARDRALAMRTLMPRAYSERTSAPAELYRTLVPSMRADVDRLVRAFQEVRRQALDEMLSAIGKP